ncbi:MULTISPECIES: PilN domain-containing protein [Pseudoalteromonas]|uniref:PilN domain-containing protein n=1 Tax=Pseudoalteromonas undina TaxID=43660 RepID=A0ACC6R1S8_9GAMM|nr:MULTISPECIES: PilN domain-containing protein [unclassified Pseudoalteromonas]KPZ55795.1 Fimbrial assembly protein (PilN) [Pseudoalteromonas sp. P1-25]KPZ59232.1 Fimbrial assembly protein (PilN) [Pseudoalteromonas sp. P1-13-1a]KPZ61768.1 Fimbrial assembly protein (PilN) [Pseudoalteromonas sp. P1-7a]
MKTRINFYQKAIRVRRDPVPFKGMLVLWLATLCVVALTWLFYLYEEHKSLQLVTQSEAYLTHTQQQLSVVKQRLADKQNKSHLIDELKVLQQEILHKQQVFDYLENTSMHTKTDYADVMHDLAAYHEPQIWLDQIKFEGQKVMLKGRTQQAKFLPIWLANLKHSSFFKGKEFSVLELSSRDGVSEFNVATELSSSEVTQ